MKNHFYIFLAVIFIGCGRGQSASIRNETGKPIIVTLGLNDIEKDPTLYLVNDALNGSKSSNHKYDGIDNYFISFDSLNSELTFKLDIDQRLELGTLRLDMTRDSLKYWEFNSIEVKGDGISLKASGDDLMKYIDKTGTIFSQRSHKLILK